MKIEIHTKIDPKLINNQILCMSDNPGGLTDSLTIILCNVEEQNSSLGFEKTMQIE